MNNRGRYIIMAIAAILLIANILSVDFEEPSWSPFLGTASNLCLILAMWLSTGNSNKKQAGEAPRA